MPAARASARNVGAPPIDAVENRSSCSGRSSSALSPVVVDAATGLKLDLYIPEGVVNAPVVVFIHGGYWRALCKEDSVFMAQNFTSLGVAVAALDYSLAPAAHLSLMVDQCRRAAAWLHRQGGALGVDTRRMVVAGSSAGAHLAAMVLASGWQATHGVPDDVARGGVLVSGLYDLQPLRYSYLQPMIQLDDGIVKRNSPAFLMRKSSTNKRRKKWVPITRS